MNSPIKIWFTDFWPGFDPKNHHLYPLLRKRFNLRLDPKPDCLIFSVFGEDHRNFDCVRVLYNGENTRPDYSVCDYAFTCDHDPSPRHVRWPLFSRYWHYLELLDLPRNIEAIEASRIRFCCMVVSNAKGQERLQLFKKLSEYCEVASGGQAMNNIGGPVDDKITFMCDYKFNICYENSCYPGYTTEKIVEAFVSGCIPIYWGNPMIGEDFNTAAFVNRHDFESDEEMIEHIIEIDRNRDLYRNYLSQPVFTTKQTDWRGYAEKVGDKFGEIFTDIRQNRRTT